MKSRQTLQIVALCVFVGMLCAGGAATAFELSRARQIILNRGVQVQAWILAESNFDVNLFTGIHYTTPDYSTLSALPQMPGTLFGTVQNGPLSYLAPYEPYANQLVSINYQDEPRPYKHLGELPLLNPTRLAEVRDCYSLRRTQFPNALMHLSTAALREYTNVDSRIRAGDEARLRTYMQQANPDLLMGDYYPPYTGSKVWSDRVTWYSHMSTFRKVAMEGYDSSGTSPIAYGQFMNQYRNSWGGAVPSESYIRMNRFGSLAFGMTVLNDSIYNITASDMDIYPTMSNGDWTPNAPVYNAVARANAEINNLSPALVRLVSNDVRMIGGTSHNSRPSNVNLWSRGAGGDNHITGITPILSEGGAADSSYSDIVVGYFQPLLDSNPDCTFADGTHFMIVNGGSDGTAANSAQWYRLAFDFIGSDFDALARLSRDTGQVEAVPLSSDGGSIYHLDLYLTGGSGDLFTFWDSSTPLPTSPKPGTNVILGTGLASLLCIIWRKRGQCII